MKHCELWNRKKTWLVLGYTHCPAIKHKEQNCLHFCVILVFWIIGSNRLGMKFSLAGMPGDRWTPAMHTAFLFTCSSVNSKIHPQKQNPICTFSSFRQTDLVLLASHFTLPEGLHRQLLLMMIWKLFSVLPFCQSWNPSAFSFYRDGRDFPVTETTPPLAVTRFSLMLVFILMAR